MSALVAVRVSTAGTQLPQLWLLLTLGHSQAVSGWGASSAPCHAQAAQGSDVIPWDPHLGGSVPLLLGTARQESPGWSLVKSVLAQEPQSHSRSKALPVPSTGESIQHLHIPGDTNPS